jgi:hypothetical protein
MLLISTMLHTYIPGYIIQIQNTHSYQFTEDDINNNNDKNASEKFNRVTPFGS